MTTASTAELLWTVHDRPRRGPKPAFTLDRIVGEAVALADGDGLAHLSMQRLAERLGCAKMALYRYVPGKADLVALMLDHALGFPPEPTGSQSDSVEPWREVLAGWTTAAYRTFRAHPWSMEIALGPRPMGPHEVAWLEAALAALAGTPLTAAERLDTVVLLTGHARNLAHQRAGIADDEGTEAAHLRVMGAVLAARSDRFPHAAAVFAELPGRDDALDFGIERILDGVGVLVASRRDPA